VGVDLHRAIALDLATVDIGKRGGVNDGTRTRVAQRRFYGSAIFQLQRIVRRRNDLAIGPSFGYRGSQLTGPADQ
jgi:hypothetical protein